MTRGSLTSIFSVVACVVACGVVVACADSTAPPVGHPDPVLSNLGTIPIGQVRDLTLSQASAGLQIPATSTYDEYAFVVSNLAINSGGATASFSLQGDTGVGDPSLASASIFAPTSQASPGRASQVNAYGVAFENRLRAIERTALPKPVDRPSFGAGTRASADVATRLPARDVLPEVGSTMSLKVLTPAGFTGENSHTCSAKGYATTTGKVRAVGIHAIVVSDVTSPGGGFTDADFQAIANDFDQLIYPTDVSYFGTPTDLDHNGHIILYFTPAVNRLTSPGIAVASGYVGGFFFAGDLFPTSGASSCASSNGGELLYLFAPDPNGSTGNTFETNFVRNATRGVLAHELQHMINSGNRHVSTVATSFEATWLDESLAHFAEDVVGRTAAGFSDARTVSDVDLNLQPTSIAQPFFNQNLSRAKYYVGRPDTTGPIVSHSRASSNLASRGAEWLLLRYVADWFSNGDPRALTMKLAAGPDTGVVNLAKASGQPIDTLIKRWTMTMLTDHTGIENLDPVYNYKSYQLRRIIGHFYIDAGEDPAPGYLPLTSIDGAKSALRVVVPSSSANYFLYDSTPGQAETIKLSSLDPNGRVYVLRVQ